jgi:hypothetical protein
MSIYTVEAITGNREFESKYGPLKSYKVKISGDDGFSGEAEITQKPTTAAPTVGQAIEGTLDKSNPKFPPKLKKAQVQSGGFSGGGKPNKDSKSIERQVAFKGAVEIVVAMLGAGQELDDPALAGTLTRYFDHGLGLIQGTPQRQAAVEAVKEAFPGTEDVGPAPSHDDMVSAWRGWSSMMAGLGKSEEDIRMIFEMKKTVIGMTDWDTATDEQKHQLITTLTEGN